jgi:hypothetical protein
MSEPAASLTTRARRRRRGTLLLSATLVATATGGCPGAPGVVAGSVPPTPPPPAVDSPCTEAQRTDAGVLKCCVRVTRPDSQSACTPQEQVVPNRCCPE